MPVAAHRGLPVRLPDLLRSGAAARDRGRRRLAADSSGRRRGPAARRSARRLARRANVRSDRRGWLLVRCGLRAVAGRQAAGQDRRHRRLLRHRRPRKGKAPVLGHFATDDQFEPAENIDDLEQQLTQAARDSP